MITPKKPAELQAAIQERVRALEGTIDSVPQYYTWEIVIRLENIFKMIPGLIPDHLSFREKEGRRRWLRLAIVTYLLGRTITSSKDLTPTEKHVLYHYLWGRPATYESRHDVDATAYAEIRELISHLDLAVVCPIGGEATDEVQEQNHPEVA